MIEEMYFASKSRSRVTFLFRSMQSTLIKFLNIWLVGKESNMTLLFGKLILLEGYRKERYSSPLIH